MKPEIDIEELLAECIRRKNMEPAVQLAVFGTAIVLIPGPCRYPFVDPCNCQRCVAHRS